MKIFISYPPLVGDGTPMLGQNRQFQWFHNPSFIYPMVTASAATLLAGKGHDVTWDDAIALRRTPEEWRANILREKPDLVAIETKTPVVKQHWGIADDIKRELPDTVVVLMGDHVTAMPDETMANCRCDYAVTGGDYDFLLDNIVDHMNGGADLEPGIWYRRGDIVVNTGAFRLDHDLNTHSPRRPRTHHVAAVRRTSLQTRAFHLHDGRARLPLGEMHVLLVDDPFPEVQDTDTESLLDEIGMLIERYGVREIYRRYGFVSLRRLARPILPRDDRARLQ
jgi:radical SAM superfamily enzyme YgiQ (UPF0313 family)